MELTMRQCRRDELSALRELSVATFTTAFGHLNKPEDMADYCEKTFGGKPLGEQMDNPESSFWFLEADGATAGYIKLNTGSAQTEDVGASAAMEIERIYVAAPFQGQGLGAYMIQRAAALAKETGKTVLWLGVWEHNERAIRFYEAHGFSRCGSHSFFLGSDEQTDILMQRDLR
ncbi:Spermidine/spermine N(1)-acetyltransferase [bioreactor metagenome]|uniref:Spermidine/spermine N(1)-acetyltransferase n=1 Tax=bioreactor metagenome TaxID=1076179 RepID=A0A645GBM3_9ZZZZ